MSVFICWSGARSKTLADAVAALLRRTLPSLKEKDKVFVSDQIEKGVAWFESIIEQLQNADAGIVCLTTENLESPWLHFESGALASRLARHAPGREPGLQASRKAPGAQAPLNAPGLQAQPAADNDASTLFTLLHGVTAAQLKGPLSAYQATSTTRRDIDALVVALRDVLRARHPKTKMPAGRLAVSAHAWSAFERSLSKIAVPVRELVPDFESLFQRKTFDEPLHHCANQAWLNRHNGVQLTYERLRSQLDLVRAACPDYETGLYEMLLSELDRYGMAVESLLLKPKKFELGRSGELEMDAGIRTCCEDHRLAIRSLVGRLLHRLDSPNRSEAVRFMSAETNEERKMIVHRLEGEVRRQWERTWARTGKSTRGATWKRTIDALTESRPALDFRESSWDLDRIYYYLLIQYFDGRVLGSAGETMLTENDLICAARDVEMEVERFRAKSKGGSLMPLTYSLVALQALGPHDASSAPEGRAAAVHALDLVEITLGTSLKSFDGGRAILQTVREIRRALAARRRAKRSKRVPLVAVTVRRRNMRPARRA